MTSLKAQHKKNNEQLAHYKFTIKKIGNTIYLEKISGTAWRKLSFGLLDNEIQYFNEMGMTNTPLPPLGIDKVSTDLIKEYNKWAHKINGEEQKYSKKIISFDNVEDVPIYPGCKGTTNNEFKNCFNKKILQHLQDNFNTDLIKNSKFKSGTENMMVEFNITKIGTITLKSIGPIAQFTIKESGKVNPIKLFGSNKKIQNELIRVINTLPRMTPGEHEGEIVTVTYNFQIYFNLDTNKIINLSPKMTSKIHTKENPTEVSLEDALEKPVLLSNSDNQPRIIEVIINRLGNYLVDSEYSSLQKLDLLLKKYDQEGKSKNIIVNIKTDTQIDAVILIDLKNVLRKNGVYKVNFTTVESK